MKERIRDFFPCSCSLKFWEVSVKKENKKTKERKKTIRNHDTNGINNHIIIKGQKQGSIWVGVGKMTLRPIKEQVNPPMNRKESISGSEELGIFNKQHNPLRCSMWDILMQWSGIKVWSLHLDFISIVMGSHSRCCNLEMG